MLDGVAPVLLASVLWGVGYFLDKILLQDISAVYLNLISAPVVSLFLLFVYRINIFDVFNVYRKNFVGLTALAFLGTTMGGILMLLGIEHMDLGVATVLEKVQPIFALLLAWLILKEKYSKKTLAYAALCITSSYFVVAKDFDEFSLGSEDTIGVICIVGAALAWATAAIIGKKLIQNDIPGHYIVFIRFTVGGICMCPLLLIPLDVVQRFSPNFTNISIAIFSAMFLTATGYLLYYKSLKYIPAALISLLELVTPLSSLSLGYIFLNEKYTQTQSVATVVLLFSVYKLSTSHK